MTAPSASRAAVLVPRPFPGPLDYSVQGQAPAPGTLVHVPLGRGKGREVVGCVWDTPQERSSTLAATAMGGAVAAARLKPLGSPLPGVPPLPATLRRFVDWVADYTMSPPGMVLAMAVRAPVQTPPRQPVPGWRPVAPEKPPGLTGAAATPTRLRVWAAAGQGTAKTVPELASAAQCGVAVVRGMINKGWLVQAEHSGAVNPTPQPDYERPTLSDDQRKAASLLVSQVDKAVFSTTLLEGVTGSGKTEVYFEAVEQALRMGRQVLVLLPEIALTAQWGSRFEKRFGCAPLIWHSALGGRARTDVWMACATGQARVVVGARSALFLPFADLGLVVVDEEHEATYKQEEGVLYHGRDMAVVRARLAGAPCILASATPSLETRANVEKGRYGHVLLPRRHGGALMPAVKLINLTKNLPAPGQWLSQPLRDAVSQTLDRGEQALLFLNRRGYAPLTLCRHCGYQFECPHCSAWMVEHKSHQRLTCHHCEHSEPAPAFCPQCGESDMLAAIGPGVERIHEEARRLWPHAELLCLASDEMKSPESLRQAIERVASGQTNLIIGTQLVAKGWHFPHLTTVGVVDADLGLNGADLRAGERTMQLLQQVAGRAGRAERPGTVWLQSWDVRHPLMQAMAHDDMAGFLEAEKAARAPGFWPPFGRLAALVVSAPIAEQAEEMAQLVASVGPHGVPGVQILGPAPAPMAFLRGRHRQRLLLKTQRSVALQPLLRQWLAKVAEVEKEHSAGRQAKSLSWQGDVRLTVDIDPVSFM
ncbi:primosomal protein N' [Formicincola oecophyllae]|uniref:Replication restart protein PriA n=1 Tax=Formicincola oecophyllae TaxID=2558361 RepID=A0A4Y6U873_9PROT|nr:primosomal protein N' [Formicincola oecophyllae]QDH13374.1 primosomal protein N' [Formicincola oecophyllae]